MAVDNVAEEIRKLLDSGVTSPKEIVARVKKLGGKVKADYVSTVKTEWLKRKRMDEPNGDIVASMELAIELVLLVGKEEAQRLVQAADRIAKRMEDRSHR